MLDLNLRKEVVHSLEEMLKTPAFRYSPKMSAFLKYVVHKTLDSDTSRIKAYTIAVEALGKPCDFDPQTDASVRVLANRLRKILLAHYESSSHHTVEIVMTSGSYVPEFIFSSEKNLLKKNIDIR